MGRILEALKKANAHRPRPVPAAPMARPHQPEADDVASDLHVVESPDEEPAEEIPFIEVGARDQPFQGSPSVLAIPLPPGRKPATPVVPDLRPQTPPALVTPTVLAPEPTGQGLVFQPIPGAPTPLAPPGKRFALELLAYHQPDHLVSEQYRVLWKAVAASLSAGRDKVLLFTAARPGAGTTTVLLNLAITAVRQGKLRVAAVDADLRHPCLASRLGLPLNPGLHEVLTGTVSLQRALQDTGVTNLVALAAGETGFGGGPRLAGEAMRSVVRHLRNRFDLVLVDAPAWDGRPEVVALGSLADAVYLVTTQADSQEVNDLLELIPQQGGRLRGSIRKQG
jgi:Mrp family chromosome partitioning ATPase